jgi:hypothetical protein
LYKLTNTRSWRKKESIIEEYDKVEKIRANGEIIDSNKWFWMRNADIKYFWNTWKENTADMKYFNKKEDEQKERIQRKRRSFIKWAIVVKNEWDQGFNTKKPIQRVEN